MLFVLLLGPASADRPAFEPLFQRAEKALAAKDLEQAVLLFEKLAGFYPQSSRAHNRLGYAHYLKGNDPRAIYSFRKALSLSRRNDQALHNLLLASGRQADALARENAFAEAETALDELIASYSWHPQHAVLLYYRGRMEFLRGKPDIGLQWWKKAASRAPGSGVAKVMAAQGRPLAKAEALYAEASAKVKTEPAFDYLLGKRQMDAKQYEKAYASFTKGLAKSREADIPFPLLSLKLAQACLATNRTEEAISVLEEAKLQRPDWASVRTLLWPAYLVANNPTAADAALQEAYELDGRPKFCLLGSAQDSVRLTTPNGSLLLAPPTGLSLPAGQISLQPSGGSAQNVTISSAQALVYRSTGGQLSEESSAVLASNTGNAGQLAPPLVAKDRRGRIYRLAESLLKQPIVILFWQVGDNDANNQLSELGAVAAHFDGVETVAIHTDPTVQKDAQRLYLSQPGTSAQLWGDNEIAAQFGVSEAPALVVIDRSGRITLTRVGPTPVLFGELFEYLESLTGTEARP